MDAIFQVEMNAKEESSNFIQVKVYKDLEVNFNHNKRKKINQRVNMTHGDILEEFESFVGKLVIFI